LYFLFTEISVCLANYENGTVSVKGSVGCIVRWWFLWFHV